MILESFYSSFTAIQNLGFQSLNEKFDLLSSKNKTTFFEVFLFQADLNPQKASLQHQKEAYNIH